MTSQTIDSTVVDDFAIDRAESMVTSELCRRDLFEYLQTMWGTIIKEDPVWNWHIPYLCRELQTVAERVIRREPKEYDLVINIPPGSTKSTICSVMLPSWVWTQDPSIRTICGSYGADLSLDLGTKCRDVCRSELFRNLFPELVFRKDIDAKGHFANKHGGERYATSTGGDIIGKHGHMIIVDDPINPKGVMSEPMLRDANDWISDTLSNRKVDKQITPVILIMQRLHEDDPTQTVLNWGDVRHICIPCDTQWNISPPELENYYVNGLMDPVRLPAKEIQKAEHVMGPIKFAGQFGQSPRALEGNMFKPGRITLVDTPPAVVRTVRYWDKAGTEGGDGSQTAGVKMGLTSDGKPVVLDSITGRWASVKREQEIRDAAELDGIRVSIWVEQEPGSGGKESAENTVRNLRGWAVHVDRVTGSKISRAEPWSVAMNRGDVMMVRGPWNDAYVREHALFPNGKLKDQVDSSAGAYNKLMHEGPRVGVW